MEEIRTHTGRIRMQAEIMAGVASEIRAGAAPDPALSDPIIGLAMVSMSVDDLAYEIEKLRTVVSQVVENTKELARIADNLTPKQE